MADLIGQSLGRYHILEQLGEGGMARVYKAYDTHLERDVAIKIIRADIFGTTVLQRIHRRFEREAKALAKLSHPNIVSVIEYGEYDGSPFLVMEYLPAGTLKGMLGKPTPWRDAVRMLIPIVKALGYSHQHGIIHRDVKPSNILVTETGDLMLTDFGIAKVLEGDDGQTLTTGTGVGVGTPEYMAPEQGLGQEADGRADIYSLGIVLYEMITGRKPFRADTPMAVIVKHINDPLPRLKQYALDIPEAVENVLSKALAKKPEDRYRNMEELAKALDGLLDRVPAKESAEVQKKVVLAGSAGVTGTTKVTTIPRQRFNPLKNRGVLWITGAGVVLIAVLGIILLGNGRPGYSLFSLFPTATSTQPAKINLIITPTATFTITPTPTLTLTPAPTAVLGVGSTWIRPADGMTMVYVPGGLFSAGSNCPELGCGMKPVRTISVEAFWIDKTEVTNAMYARCVDENVCVPPYPYKSVTSYSHREYYNLSEYADYPVVYIDHSQAETYCGWVQARLPSDEEWEKAARGTDGRIMPWGNDHTGLEANYCDPSCSVAYQRGGDTLPDGYSRLAPVGSFPLYPSPYGALDMAGNVGEMLADDYVRGGSWASAARAMHTFEKARADGTLTYKVPGDTVGFRCVASASEVDTSQTDTSLSTGTASAVVDNSTPSPVVLAGTADPNCVDSAEFVEDLTVLDGMEFSAESPFVKTWRVKNTGTCTWTSDYSLILPPAIRWDDPRALPPPKPLHRGRQLTFHWI